MGDKGYSDGVRQPAQQARAGRCGACFLDGEPARCSRWKGHSGPHRGPREGRFYGGDRFEWTDAEYDPADENEGFLRDRAGQAEDEAIVAALPEDKR